MGSAATKPKHAGEEGLTESIVQPDAQSDITSSSFDLQDPRSPSCSRRTPLHTPERATLQLTPAELDVLITPQRKASANEDPRSPTTQIIRTPMTLFDQPYAVIEESIDPRSPFDGRTPLKPLSSSNGAEVESMKEEQVTTASSSISEEPAKEESTCSYSTALITITEEVSMVTEGPPAQKDTSIPRKRKNKPSRVDNLLPTPPPLKKSYSEPLSSENIHPSFSKKIGSSPGGVPRAPLSPLTSRSMNSRFQQRNIDFRLDETVKS